MAKLKELAKVLNTTTNWIKNNIDEEMVDIIYELNNKGYKTFGCCQGHLDNKDDSWHSYIGFSRAYEFYKYPLIDSYRMSKTSSSGLCLYWDGKGEENRKKCIEQILEWALYLPQCTYRKPLYYWLYIKNKNETKTFIKRSTNKQEILLEKARRKYVGKELIIEEKEC